MRIRFPGNPWPRGHAIRRAAWTGELGPEGLRFHLHLETAAYDAEDDRPDRRDPGDDWRARTAWTNFEACILSSTYWGHAGFVVATPGRPLDLERLEGKTFRVDRIAGDRLPDELQYDELAFGIYLLGHDSVAGHRIRFTRRRGPRTYDVRWRARIALTYSGQDELAHSLDASLTRLRLRRIDLADEVSTGEARALLASVLVGADRFARRGRRFLAR